LENNEIGIGLLGLGVISGQVARVLRDKAGVISDYVGCPVVLKKVKVLPQDLERPLARELDSALFTTDENEFFNEPGINIIIEAIGKEYPAFDYQKRALSSGRYIVTANKEVISKHGPELFALAREHDVSVRYEASVGGGIPLISPFMFDLVANKIEGIYAIINGTTNYILSRMAKEGVEFSAALKQAQQLGYAETNPRDDVEGIDATYKLAILASLGFQTQVKPKDIYCEGISRLTSRDFLYAKELGYAIKLLAIGKQDDKWVEVRVHPVFIPEDSLLAKVDGVYNAILVEGDLVGKVLFYGQGAGPLPTSSAIIADVISVSQDIVLHAGNRVHWSPEAKRIKPISEINTRYYLRMSVADEPGVLARISQILGDNRISIASLIQKDTDTPTQTAEIVIMTHPANEAAMQRSIQEMSRLPVVREISNFIRVEE
jgi:homoserine dehydrogenase